MAAHGQRADLRDILPSRPAASRIDRLVCFKPPLRASVVELLVESGHNIEGTENDEALCAWVLGLSSEVVFDGMHGAFEVELVEALSTAQGRIAVDEAIAAMPHLTGHGVAGAEIQRRLAAFEGETSIYQVEHDPEVVDSADRLGRPA